MLTAGMVLNSSLVPRAGSPIAIFASFTGALSIANNCLVMYVLRGHQRQGVGRTVTCAYDVASSEAFTSKVERTCLQVGECRLTL
jgi:hypothetical protein